MKSVKDLMMRQPDEIKGEKLYEGKAKALYRTPVDGVMLMEFKDDATAFDGKKKGTIVEKGYFNAQISAILLRYLEECGIQTHFIDQMAERYHLVSELDMLSVEVVMRNIAAGSLARRLGFEEGQVMAYPILEFYYKDDALSDPWLNASHIKAMDLATDDEVLCLEEKGRQVNEYLQRFLQPRGLQLVDFKLEFGRDSEGVLILGDEITPDTCRFWDVGSGDKLDKDRFRQDLGDVEDAYKEVLRRVSQEVPLCG